MSASRNVRPPRPVAGRGPWARVAVALTGLAALGTLLGGCGEQGAGDSSGPAASVSAVPVDGSLTVTLDGGPGGPRTWELSCAGGDAVAGDHPAAGAACAAVASAGDPWAPVEGGAACTMIYGGPLVATVRGTWDGVDVDARFDRSDGCQVARWDRLAPLLQPGTTVDDPGGVR